MTSSRALRIAMAIATAFFLCVTILTSCKKKGPIPFNPAFAQYISAFTSGTISNKSTIRIRFTDVFMPDVQTGVALEEEFIEFSPDIDGELIWLDNQTLQFTPKESLPRGKAYEAELHLSKITSVPKDLAEFPFSFMVMNQHMEVSTTSIKAYRNDDLKWMQYTGKVTTMDDSEIDGLNGTIQVKENGRILPVNFIPGNDSHIHYFTVDSIARTDQAQTLELAWDGDKIEADQEGSMEIQIPALGDFKVFHFETVQEPEQYIQLQFSDPLLGIQNLEGLIDLADSYYERFSIDGNQVRVYPSSRLVGDHKLYVHAGIKNLAEFANSEEQTFDIHFEHMKPEVVIDDPEKVILPSTDGLVFPFRAVNLSAVDVRVIRIYENNVPQFLQVNDLNGEDEMKRVGRIIKRKTVQLNPEGNKDLAVWNNFFLDLDEIIEEEPGAIYRVEIGFKKSYSLYPCESSDPDEAAHMQNTEELVQEQNLSTPDDESWDTPYGYYEYYDDYYYEDYNYSERNDPCKLSYYINHDPVGKNVLASDLGMIAKKGQNKELLVVINDMKSTAPLSGVQIEVLNYQQKVIAKGQTNGDGIFKLEESKGVPFLIVAKYGKQRGYLKVHDSNALSLSMFDIKGEESQKGLKGFIYGERGVWRPGDSLYLSFILEDEMKQLPEIHPVHFELQNPRGQIVQKMVRSKGEHGFFSFRTKTDDNAETGNYQAIVRVGGAVFSKVLKIETIKPNRLKLKVDFDRDILSASDGGIKGNLEAKWLHGATARNLKANISATFTSVPTAFPAYEDYEFNDPTKSFYPEEMVLFDGQINDQGQAALAMQPQLYGRAPGMLNAQFSVKVFEESGDFSVDRFSMPYAPYNTFVGVELPKPSEKYNYALDTDKPYSVDVVTLNSQGKPVSADSVQWKVYKVEWRWWWEHNSYELASYVGNESTIPVAVGMMKTGGDGKGKFNLTIPKSEWGRYLIRVEDLKGGHAAGSTTYFDWPYTENRASRNNEEGAHVLTFSLDKDKYITGDKCTVTFPSSAGGRALVSIENSVGVLQTQWVATSAEQTSFTFQTDEAMTPNAYIHVSLLQPHSQTANDLPIRLYGIMPLFVEHPGSHLEPVIRMADELAPEKNFEVTVNEKSGKPMTYTIAIVDEGLLDLTRFQTPDPWNHFYSREALGVSTFDMYDEVIGAFGTKLEKALSLGGSDEGKNKNKNMANRFKPVVLYAGPFTVEKGKSKTHRFTMPNYVGSVRVMVVAGQDQAYGNAEKTVAVKKPLMVLASLPRVVGPGEEMKLPVTIFSMEKSIKKADIKIEANEFFQFTEGTQKSVEFAEPGDDVVNFPLRITDKVGIGKVKVTATSGSFKSTYEIEIDVRNPNPVMTNMLDAAVDAGQTWQGQFDLAGIEGTNSAELEISSVPSIDFGRRLKYLMTYPHGCIEQTTSGAFPQLYLSDVMDLNDQEIKTTTENVKAAINALSRFQTGKGGMGYWPGDRYEDEWGTSYAGHFMLEAKKKGYTLPGNWETNWISYQTKMAQNWQVQNAQSGNYYWRENDLVQAYRLFTLALAGKPELGAMNRLKEYSNMSTASRWRLAAAFVLAGQKETAQSLVYSAPLSIAPYRSLGYTYGSDTRDQAMIIETLMLLGDRSKAAPLAIELAKKLSSPQWESTQTVAYGLLAMSRFSAGQNGGSWQFSYTLNGKASGIKGTNKALMRISLPTNQLKGNSIQFKNESGMLLYARVITQGQPSAGNETAVNQDLYIEVKYYDMKGREIQPNRMEQGTDFIAEARVWNPGLRGKLDELALAQVFPSGWEIINQRMDASAAVMNAFVPEYQDVRDDRVYSYFDLLPNETKIFKIKLNASYLGKFYLPGVKCEAMYDETIQSRVTGKWVEVIPPGAPMATR